MCARTHPNLSLLKKHDEDRPPHAPPEPKLIEKRKRLGEIYVTTDELDRLTLQASAFKTHSDEKFPLRSNCFSHLSTRSGPSVHLCWQFDDTHRAGQSLKSAELIRVINKIVKILKSLEADENEFPDASRDSLRKNGVVKGQTLEMQIPVRKVPQNDYATREDWDLTRRENIMKSVKDKTGTSTFRSMKKADKVPASRFEKRRNRWAGEHDRPSKGTKSTHTQGCQISPSDSSSGSKSWYRAPDNYEPLENVDEGSRGEQAPGDEGLAPEPAADFDVFTPASDKEHEFGWGSDGDFSDCEILGVQTYTTPGNKRNKFKHSKYDSDEEMDKSDPCPGKHGSEGRETPILKSSSGFEIKAESKVDFQHGEEGTCIGGQRRKNMGSFARDLGEEIPGIRADVAGEMRDENRQQTESSGDSAPESSEDSLLYEDEQMFHDSVVRESKGKTSKLHEVFTMNLRSGFDLSQNSRAGPDNNAHDSRNRRKRSQPRSKTSQYEAVSVPEVDRVFMGPKCKTLDPRVRVKTILDQFQYLVNFYRSKASTKETVKGCRARPDIEAGKYMMAKRFCFNEGWSIVGSIPGVEVGDMFTCREQLLILIVHRTSQAGIEFIPARKSGYVDKNGCPVSVAVSVVSAGGYKDNEDDGETLTYVGSGGEKNMTHSRVLADYTGIEKDQELVRGNLALKNSCDMDVPVRVIRGEKCADGEVVKKRYWYDGLYNVKKYYEDVGSAGSKVWKFQLVKQKGQRET